jgi:hypothetical protein
MGAEHSLLLKFFEETERQGSWFRIPAYPVSQLHAWNRESTDVAFQASPTHPATAPYGFYVLAGLRCDGECPQNYSEAPSARPPFPGDWGMFSWSIADNGTWVPRVDLVSGANLLNYVRSFADRFKEGR